MTKKKTHSRMKGKRKIDVPPWISKQSPMVNCMLSQSSVWWTLPKHHRSSFSICCCIFMNSETQKFPKQLANNFTQLLLISLYEVTYSSPNDRYYFLRKPNIMNYKQDSCILKKKNRIYYLFSFMLMKCWMGRYMARVSPSKSDLLIEIQFVWC